MRSVLFLAIAALALFAGLSAASPASAAHVASSSDLLAQYVENEPSAMFSRRQLAERPSRVKSKKLAARASVTPLSYDHNIQIINADGSVAGYLTRGVTKERYWIFTTSKKDAVAFAAPSSGATRNLQFASSGNNMLGTSAYGSRTLSTNIYYYAGFTGSVATPPGSVPMSVSGDLTVADGVETAVWQYNSSTGALSLVWVNSDGSRITLEHVIASRTLTVYSVGSAAKFSEKHNDQKYYKVTFKLVKI